MTFDGFLEFIQHLKVDRSGPVPKPYKPVLLCSVVLQIHKGEIRSPEVLFDGGIRSVFDQLLRILYGDLFPTATIKYPFRHLEKEVWHLVPKEGLDERLREAMASGSDAWKVMGNVRSARLDEAVFNALYLSPEKRLTVVRTLAVAYRFPPDRVPRLLELFNADTSAIEGVRERPPVVLKETVLEQYLQVNWRHTVFARQGIHLCTYERHGTAGRQVQTRVSAIDLLGHHESDPVWWVFELKKDRPSDAVVGQIQRYMEWMKDEHPADAVRGAIIARDTDAKLRYSARANPDLSLWRFDDNCDLHPVPLERPMAAG